MASREPSRSDDGGASVANAPLQLRVETAAIRIGEAVFTLPRPNRHHNVMWWLSTLGIGSGQMHDQGFVLSDGSYASRRRAYGVAEDAGQLLGDPPVLGTLFSEDVWDGGAKLASIEQIKALTALPDPPVGA